MSVYSDIKTVMDKYGIPEYIWFPIAQTESGLNPNAANITAREQSYGIFQINRQAHPQYAAYNLNDPVVNATIAARDFIAPAYEYAKTATTDKERQALIVYSGLKDPENLDSHKYITGGIKPKWTDATRARFIKNFSVAFGGGGSGGFGGGDGYTGNTTTPAATSGALSLGQSAIRIVFIIGLIGIIVFAVFNLFKQTDIGQAVIPSTSPQDVINKIKGV